MGSKTKVKTKRKKTEEKVSSKSSKKRKAKQKQNEKESRKRKLESSKKSSKSKSSKKIKKTPTDYRNILGLADKDRPGMSEEKKLRLDNKQSFKCRPLTSRHLRNHNFL